jgi:hypothetical protein
VIGSDKSTPGLVEQIGLAVESSDGIDVGLRSGFHWEAISGV